MKSVVIFAFFALAVALTTGQNDTTVTDAVTLTTEEVTETIMTNEPTALPKNETTTPELNSTTPEPTTADETSTAVVTGESTTTQKPVSTTPKPVDHSVLFYVEEGGIKCIVLNSTLQLTFSYTDDDNTPNNHSMYVPKNAKVSGTCNGTQMMILSFDKNVMTFIFGKDSKNTYIQNMTLLFTMDHSTFPGIHTDRDNLTVSNNQQTYKGSNTLPYLCKSNKNTTLSSNDEATTAVLTTMNFEFEAFRTKNTTDLGDKYANCPEDSVTSNIVPIAVGAALAALVVIVLIAYLISRNRAQRGYESV